MIIAVIISIVTNTEKCVVRVNLQSKTEFYSVMINYLSITGLLVCKLSQFLGPIWITVAISTVHSR